MEPYSIMDLMFGFYVLEDTLLSIPRQEYKGPLSADKEHADAIYWREELDPEAVSYGAMPWHLSRKGLSRKQAFWLEKSWSIKINAAYNQVAEDKTRYDRKLALLLHDYIVGICLAEARHADYRAEQHIPGLRESGGGEGRLGVALQAHLYEPKALLVSLIELFSLKWTTAYGGAAWQKIAEAGLMYYTQPHSVFIDHAADLSHNGGLAFDKCFLIGLDSESNYKQMLDAKRDTTIWDFACFNDIYVPRLLMKHIKPGRQSVRAMPSTGADVLNYKGIEYADGRVEPFVKSPDFKRDARRKDRSKDLREYEHLCSCIKCKAYEKLLKREQQDD